MTQSQDHGEEKHVIFAAPFFMDATLAFIDGATHLPNTKLTVLSHMEWLHLQNNRIAISEVGARPPGAQFTSLLSYAHDINFYQAWPHLLVFEEFHPPERKYACGAA